MRDPALVRRVDGGSRASAAQPSGVATCRPSRRHRRCSRRFACAGSCWRTASWCRRCASTRPKTATIGDWHLVHLGSRAIGGAGSRHRGDDRRQRRGAHHARLCRHLSRPSTRPSWARVVAFVHRHSAPRSAFSSRTPAARASTRRAMGRRGRAAARGESWPLLSASPLPWPRRQPGAEANGSG